MWLIYNLINLYELIVILSVVFSWFRLSPYNPLVRFVYSITRPVFLRVRMTFPFVVMNNGLDLSPLVVILGLELLRGFVWRPWFIFPR